MLTVDTYNSTVTGNASGASAVTLPETYHHGGSGLAGLTMSTVSGRVVGMR
jgi:hypothetical protein